MAKLFMVATPIGNLGDITIRAIEVLKSVDLILAEDTRVARKLLSRFEISKPLVSFREHSSPKTFENIAKMLESGKNLAFVSDAGTPGISDPGQRLVAYLETRFPSCTVPVPGPSAISAIISVSDIDLSKFCFLGFPPHKKGRQKFFKKVAESEFPIILYESPHRIQKTLNELKLACGDLYINIGRELTKIYEEVFRGNISEAQKHFVGEKQRGEFVVALDIKSSSHIYA